MSRLSNKILLLLLLLPCIQIYACDVCGVSLSSINNGLLNQTSGQYIGLGYNSSAFRSNQLSYDRDRYQSMEVSAQIRVKKRFFIGIKQGYRWSQRSENDRESQIHGLSNLNSSISYLWYDKQELTIRTGVLTKWPTGDYRGSIHDENLPENFSPSDGSWGLGVSTLIHFSRGKNGIQLSANYMYTFPDPNQYQIGWAMATDMTYYRSLAHNQWVFRPYIGLRIECVGPDRYPTKSERIDTGGSGLLASLGGSVTYEKFTLGAQIQLPTLSKYAGGKIDPTSRMQIQINYLIK